METNLSIQRVKPRGDGRKFASVVPLVLFICCAVLYIEPPVEQNGFKLNITQVGYIILIITTGVLVVFLAELLYRCLLLAEEHKHLEGRYHGNIWEMLSSVFKMPLPSILVICTCICYNVIAIQPDVIIGFWKVYSPLMMTQLFLNGVVLYWLQLRGPCKVELSDISEKHNLNVAHGLAWSFYYGYLRLILPTMKERIQRSKWFESRSDSCKMVPQLVILLPESCFAFPTLTDADDRIQHEGKIEEVRANRAGCVARPYWNNVYSIKHEASGKSYYCVVEYATPLLSLYEMSIGGEAGLSREAKVEQMKLFYTTLSNILKQAPGGENCILLAFKDKLDNGQEYPISELIVQTIEQEESCLHQAGMQ